MRYASICDGIGAVHCAWQPLGWECAWASEIEPFPIAVVDHHWHLPNLGDMTEITDEQLAEHGPVDLVCGGTPCQSFSVAGLRKGMADPRGNLALVFLGLVDRIRPRWVVWENVPGVLSSGEGRDFGAFLGALGQLGYGWSYRVLDAEYFGVPQRRRRVFVVGCLGDWRRAAAVLFERESLQGNPPPSREAGQRVAACFTAGAHPDGHNGQDDTKEGRLIPAPTMIKGVAIGRKPEAGPQYGEILEDGSSYTLNCTEVHAVAIQNATRGKGQNGLGVSEDGPMYTLDDGSQHAVAFAQNTRDEVRLLGGDGQIAGALAAEPGMKQTTYVAQTQEPFCHKCKEHRCTIDHNAVLCPKCGFVGVVGLLDKDYVPALQASRGTGSDAKPLVAFPINTQMAIHRESLEGTREGLGLGKEGDPAFTLQSSHGHAVATPMAVRRLTPRECARLQGFADDYCAITYKDKPAADGPQYRAFGNSMAVPCMAWIGERIEMVEAIL